MIKKFKSFAVAATLSSGRSTLSSEIALALLVKFILLAGLWWIFFAGHKQIVDDQRVHTLFFNEPGLSTERGTDDR